VAALLAPLILHAAGGAGAGQADDAPTAAAAGVERVAVDVVVTDKQGWPVTGLTARDFVLREDGALQSLASFEAVDLARGRGRPGISGRSPLLLPSTNVGEAGSGPRRTFVLVFDDLHLGAKGAVSAKRALERFLDAGTAPGDLVTLVVPGTGLVWSATMPEDRGALSDVLRPIRGQQAPPGAPISDDEAVRIVRDNDAGAQEVVRRRFQLAGTLPEGDPPAPPSSGAAKKGPDDVHRDPGQFLHSEARHVFDAAQRQRRRVLEVTTSALEGLADVKGRKSVLLVSEGFVHESDEPQLRELLSASRKGNAAVYYLDAGGLASEGDVGDGAPSDADRATRRDDSEGAEIAALDTGGFALRDAGHLDEGLARISRESSSYYLVGYSPTNPRRDGGFHRISVEVTRPDVVVRARAGYYAPSDSMKDEKANRKIDPQLESALRRPCAIDRIPLRLTAFAFQPVERGRTRVTLASEIGVKDFALENGPGGSLTTSVDVAMAIVHAKPGASVVTPWREWKVAIPATRREEAWAPLQSSFELPPGRCQAKLIVRDRRTGALGSVIHSFEVPEPGGWRISSPVLSDAPATESGGRPRLFASRDFAPGGALYCYFEVYDAARDASTGRPRVSYSYSLVDGNGAVKLAGSPAPVAAGEGGRLARLVEVPLAGVGPGQYELVLNVRDEAAGSARELREPFRVGQSPRARAGVYLELVRAFLEGGVSPDAMSRLARWSPKDLAKGVATLPADDETLNRAALLLHTEIAIDRRQRGAVAEAANHLATARALLETTTSPKLRRDWLLAVGYYRQYRSSFVEALALFTECARLFPDAAEAWLGAGTAHEYTAYPDGIGGERLPETIHDAAQEAERCYREAIRIDPGLAEARLRLGRVLRLAGRLREAEQEFAAAIAASREGYVTGLANLFWGELREERGDLAEAIRHYRAALEADADLQSAALALSHALRASGRAREASEILPPALRLDEDRRPSPWLEYHLGLGRRYRSALAGLREGLPVVAAGSSP
jgi:VWFA-related protein